MLLRGGASGVIETHHIESLADFEEFGGRHFSNPESSDSDSSPLSNLWFLKDANTNGAGGVWVLSSKTFQSFLPASPISPLHLDKHKYVIQKYVEPPMLNEGRKCHVRVYGLLVAGDCDSETNLKSFVHRSAFLHVANKPFIQSNQSTDEEDDQIHITNCCANSDDASKFVGEISVDLLSDPEYSLFLPSILNTLRSYTLSIQPYLDGGFGNGALEYLGMDFIFSHNPRNSTYDAFLLEINAPPSQDTATGLKHAEELHDRVVGDVVRGFVIPNCTEGKVESDKGGWMDSDVTPTSTPKRNTTTPTAAPTPYSRSASVNKLKWGMLEKRFKRTSPQTLTIGGGGVSSEVISTFARQNFPYFDSKNSGLEKLFSFFENAGGAQVPAQVTAKVVDALQNRWRNEVGSKWKREGKSALAQILGAKPDTRVVLGANATSLLRELASKYDRLLRDGDDDEIIVSTANHQANIAPWLDLVQRVPGVKIVWWDQTSESHANDLTNLVTTRTRLVAIPHCSNVFGHLLNLKPTLQQIRNVAPGAHVVIDGVAAAPHRYADFSSFETGREVYVVSCQKLFGPCLGGMVCGGDAVRELEEAAAADEGNEEECGGDRFWEKGTMNFEGCAGVVGMLDYFLALGSLGISESESKKRDNKALVKLAYDNIELAEALPLTLLLTRFERWESTTKNLDVIRPHNSNDFRVMSRRRRLPILTFVHKTLASSVIVAALKEKGIVGRCGFFLSDRCVKKWGSHETSPFGKHFGTGGGVRISLAHYNTAGEVEGLVRVLEGIEGW